MHGPEIDRYRRILHLAALDVGGEEGGVARVAGDLRLHELRQIRLRGPSDADDGRLARRATDPRDPRVDAVQILHGAAAAAHLLCITNFTIHGYYCYMRRTSGNLRRHCREVNGSRAVLGLREREKQRLLGNLAAVCTAEGEAAGAVVAAKASPCDICRGGEREKATGKEMLEYSMRKKEKVGKEKTFNRVFVRYGLRRLLLLSR
jgi:hypothetical protein